MMHRRQFLTHVTTSFVAAMNLPVGASEAAPKRNTGATNPQLGMCLYSLKNRLRQSRQSRRREDFLTEPITFLHHCHKLGAAGIQMPLGIRPLDQTERIRSEAERLNMFLEAIVALPGGTPDLELFESALKTAREAGASIARIVTMPGRRYEQFKTYQQCLDQQRHSLEMIRKIEPIAAGSGVHLAIENHKDRTTEEFLDLLDRVPSPYIGVCYDTGNNLALMEDPVEAARKLASRTISVHLKDQAVCSCDEGFLLADVPLGLGVIDIRQIVKTLKEANPDLRFSLEQITRDPIVVPVLTQQYWQTLPGVPAENLARVLRIVRRCGDRSLCGTIEDLPLPQRCQLEERNIRQSFTYAADIL